MFVLGRDTVRKARNGWHNSARSRQVLNMFKYTNPTLSIRAEDSKTAAIAI
jgi:hypothetical protein